MIHMPPPTNPNQAAHTFEELTPTPTLTLTLTLTLTPTLTLTRLDDDPYAAAERAEHDDEADADVDLGCHATRWYVRYCTLGGYTRRLARVHRTYSSAYPGQTALCLRYVQPVRTVRRSRDVYVSTQA